MRRGQNKQTWKESNMKENLLCSLNDLTMKGHFLQRLESGDRPCGRFSCLNRVGTSAKRVLFFSIRYQVLGLEEEL